MGIKYIIAFLLAFMAISCAVLLVIFLASAALYGSLSLPLFCLVFMVIFFFIVSALNKNK
jgi:hypothetical protein